MQVAAVLVRLFIPLNQPSTPAHTVQQYSTLNTPGGSFDPLNRLNLHTTVAIQVDQTELITDVPSAVVETICSILELSPFSLVEVQGTHLDTVTVKLKHITPTALQTAAATDCVLAALLKIQAAESKWVGRGGGGGGGAGAGAGGRGTGTGTWAGGEEKRMRTREVESSSNMYSDSDDDNDDEQKGRWGARGTTLGYGDLVPEFCVSLLFLVTESTAVIFEAERGSMYSTVTAMTRYTDNLC
jgi:hypothetical protein